MFCIVVAGKNSRQQAKKLEAFLNFPSYLHLSPFERIRRLDGFGLLTGELMKVKMGQYTRITNAFRQVAKLPSLTTITLAELEQVKGIGMKTSRFFMLHSRPNQRLAVLDTHILKWLKERWVHTSVPKATPARAKYLELEKVFLDYADGRDWTPAQLDLYIWTERAKKSPLTALKP